MPFLRRLLGAGLLVATYVPLHRLLDPSRTGLAGATTRRVADAVWLSGLWGTVLVLTLAVALAHLTQMHPWAPAVKVLKTWRSVSLRAWSSGCAVLAFVLSAGASLVLFGALPTTVDEMVQLLHAQALLAGGTALPLPGHPAAWMTQNAVLVSGGWTSVYPPGHTLALAGGLALGRAWLVGPLATALLVGATTLALGRLLPRHPGTVRVASLLTALSPFVLLLGGTHLSHTVAGALTALLVYTALRAREGGPGWSVFAGLVVGALVCTRPWAGVTLSVSILSTAWLPGLIRHGASWATARVGALALGGAPFAVLLLGWNQNLFKDPFTLGYTAAFGPAHGLGLHPDPWGNAYGAPEALAYAGADLLQLSPALLESPLPLLALLGVGLILTRGAWARAPLLLVWALSGVAANAVYWHHGIHLGPRLLYETAPAWLALSVLSGWALAREGGPLPAWARRTVAWAVVLCAVAAAALLPSRVMAARNSAASSAVLPSPPLTPALVFAHGSWSSRVAARLVASGMRRDSVETALRRNDLCAVDGYARMREAGISPPSGSLDLRPLPGPNPELSPRVISPGNVVLAHPALPPTEACLREARADSRGTVELEPLLWQAPPVAGSDVMVARDLGPRDNAATRAAFPDVPAFLLVTLGAEGGMHYLPYEEGMSLLWGAEPDGTVSPGGE